MKKDEYKSNIFDNSRLEESTSYSKSEVIEDMKDKGISMLPKWISIFRSKGLFGFILWTFFVFSSFWYKNSTLPLPWKQNIWETQSGQGYILLNPNQSLTFSVILLITYILLWIMLYIRNTRMKNI